MSKTVITKQQLKEAIPAHCFERSYIISFAYLFADFFAIAAMYYLSGFIALAPSFTQPILWFIWCFLQGTFMTGVWVIAHECGHQAFSPSTLVNDTVGFICHSALLVPYFAWKLTHAAHHANTGNIEKDEVWVPDEKKHVENSSIVKFYNDAESPIGNFIVLVVVLLVGWPMYLITNGTSNKTHQNVRANHFEPSSPLFKPRHRKLIIASNIGILMMVIALIWMIYALGFKLFLVYYFIPYLWTNAWLVGITFLQHTSKDIKYYESSEWTFVKGAMQTIDRKYGIFDYLLHHITDTHVCHHFFHQIPHYHATEATKHIKKLLGDQYLYDETPFYIALYREMRDCKFVEGDKIKTYVQ